MSTQSACKNIGIRKLEFGINSLSLKYQRFPPSGWKGIRIVFNFQYFVNLM